MEDDCWGGGGVEGEKEKGSVREETEDSGRVDPLRSAERFIFLSSI